MHTQRGFRRGGGAEGRKTVSTRAIAPDGGVYVVEQAAAWPWRIEYEARLCVAEEEAAERWMQVKIRLGRTPRGEAGAVVRIRKTETDGRPMGNAGWEQVVVQLAGGGTDEAVEGLRAMFWPFGWEGRRRQEGGMRAAIERAAEAAADGGFATRWERCREVLGGALPQLTWQERAEERRRKEAHCEEAAQAAAAAEAGRVARGEVATPAEQAVEAKARAREACAREAATVLGVVAGAAAMEVRRAYLAAALRLHPNKGGDGAKCKELHAAHELLRAYMNEHAQRWQEMAGGGAETGGVPGGEGADAGVGRAATRARAAAEAA